MALELTDVPKVCPRCGRPLQKRQGEYGTYLDCTGYPECKYTFDASVRNKTESEKISVSLPAMCPKCNKKLAVYIGVNGAFFGCNGYPNCRYSFNIENLENVKCPKCGNLMTERTGKHGLFLGCKSYPDCKFTYPLRISKTLKSEAKREVKHRKKLEFKKQEGPLSNDKLLDILKEEWHTFAQIASKLNINEKSDLKFLSLKIKRLERKKVLDVRFHDGYESWKTSKDVEMKEPPSIMKVDKKRKKKKDYVYVLRLENNKWWVGKSKKPSEMITKHKHGTGSIWTSENRVISTEETIENGDLTDLTIKYMKKYGWKNVRGSSFNDSYYVYIPKKIKTYIKRQEGGKEFFAEKAKSLEPRFVFILKLEHEKWYVGSAANVEKQVEEMKIAGGNWTQMHKILRVQEIIENGDLKEITLDYMRKYGWQNVRGYAWSAWNLKESPEELRDG